MKQSMQPPSAEPIAAGLRRLRAPNPSPMTFTGTNTYIVGEGAVALIDPGPDDDTHLEAIRRCLGKDEEITHILVTHSHLDHSALANRLSAETGAPVLAFGDSAAGRRPETSALGSIGGGEGVDTGFRPHVQLEDGQVISSANWSIRAHWTPGHFGNHMCFEWEGMVFSGDLVMGWASSLVSPPDGDLSDFLESLDALGQLGARRFFPGHGEPVEDPAARLDWLRSHRMAREAEILSALDNGPATAAELTSLIYVATPAHLHPAAERNVLAHLIALSRRGQIHHHGALAATTRFCRWRS